MLFNVSMRIGRGDTGEHVLDQLSAYIDYELADAERERVRDHLRRCPACENELATLRATKQLLTESPLHPVPRSFVLTPDMVGRGITGPVERRRSFGWTLAGRLRTASALVAVLLVLVLSGDVLSRSGLGSDSGALYAPAPSINSAPDSDTNAYRTVINPTTQAFAEATTTTSAPSDAGGLGGAEPPAAPLDAASPSTAAAPVSVPEDTLTNNAPTQATSTTPTPLGLFLMTGTQSETPDTLTRHYSDKSVIAEAAATPPVNGWQLAEGALLILLLVLGGGALWARTRGV